MVMSLLLGKSATPVVYNWDVYHIMALELVVGTYKLLFPEPANTGLDLATMTSNDSLLKRDLS